MSLGMASLGKTEAFLYTILPTSIGVLVTSLLQTTDIIFGITALALTTSIGSMLLYTIRPDVWLITRTYRKDSKEQLEVIAKSVANWLFLFKAWKIPFSSYYVTGSYESSEIAETEVLRIIESSIGSTTFLKRIWRIRVTFFAGLSIASLIAASIFYFGMILSSVDMSFLLIIVLTFIYMASLVPFWTVRKLQRVDISEFAIAISQFYSLTTIFSGLRTYGGHTELSLSPDVMREEIGGLEEVLDREDWFQFQLRWRVFQDTLAGLAVENFHEDWMWDLLTEWENVIISYTTARGGSVAARRMHVFLLLNGFVTGNMDYRLSQFEQRLLKYLLDSLDKWLEEDTMSVLTSIRHPTALEEMTRKFPAMENHKAEVWMWLERVRTFSDSAQSAHEIMALPSPMQVTGRTRNRYLPFWEACVE